LQKTEIIATRKYVTYTCKEETDVGGVFNVEIVAEECDRRYFPYLSKV
jgi:hypothetical protein